MAELPAPDRPDLPTPVDRPTIVGLVLAIAGTIMAVPFLLLSLPYYSFPGDVPPPGWQSALRGAAFWVGTPSLIIGIARYRRAGRSGDRRGRRWAGVLINLALMGAAIWVFPSCVEASTGL